MLTGKIFIIVSVIILAYAFYRRRNSFEYHASREIRKMMKGIKGSSFKKELEARVYNPTVMNAMGKANTIKFLFIVGIVSLFIGIILIFKG